VHGSVSTHTQEIALGLHAGAGTPTQATQAAW